MSQAAAAVQDAETIHWPAGGLGSDPVVVAHRICRSAAWISKGPLVANPTCACTSCTQGAYPLP